MSFVRRGRASLLIAAVLALVAGDIAYASIPDSNGVVHGCYKASGALNGPSVRAGSRSLARGGGEA